MVFRECGRQLVCALAGYLDSPSGMEAERRLASAEQAATQQGRIAARHGVAIGDTVGLFLRFRAQFLHQLGAAARRKGVDASDATSLLESAIDAIDRVVPALIAGHQDEIGTRCRPNELRSPSSR